MEHEPLKIHIVGAGIGGLVAAITLRRPGHVVEVRQDSALSMLENLTEKVWEKQPPYFWRDFPTENLSTRPLLLTFTGIQALQNIGIDITELEPTKVTRIAELYRNGFWAGRTFFEKEVDECMSAPWYWVFWHHLYEALFKLAVDPYVASATVNFNFHRTVCALNPEQGIVELSDGDVHNGDIIIGADGEDSVVREAIRDGEPLLNFESYSILEFAVPATNMIDHRYLFHDGEHWKSALCNIGWYQSVAAPKAFEKDKAAIYTSTETENMHIIVTVPESDPPSMFDRLILEAWLARTILNRRKDLAPLVFCQKQLESEFKISSAKCCGPMINWTRGKAALLGDAAHTIHKSFSFDINCTLEDATALSKVLSCDFKREEVENRLKRYKEMRLAEMAKLQFQFDRTRKISSTKGKDINSFMVDSESPCNWSGKELKF